MTLALQQSASNYSNYSETYIQSIFTLWYTKGKPRGKMLVNMIEDVDPISGTRPSASTLNTMIKNKFLAWAEELDKEVAEQMKSTLVAEKVALLQRHATVAREMQEMGLTYLRENGVGGARNAIQLLIEGLEIERNSVGTPKISQKLMDMSDEQLLDALVKTVSGSPITEITPYPNDEVE